MKLQRKSTDGCGVVIWWFDNNTRIVRVPKEHTQGNFPVYVAETGFRIGENFKALTSYLGKALKARAYV